jgi:hypothetical protein
MSYFITAPHEQNKADLISAQCKLNQDFLLFIIFSSSRSFVEATEAFVLDLHVVIVL